MPAYLLRRIAQLAIVVALVATVAFFLIQLAPGDPFSAAMTHPNLDPSVSQQWRESYGLHRPVSEQYARYLVNLARGDLGWSFSHQRPVAGVLRDTLPNTILLVSLALAASFVLGILVGVIQVRWHGSLADRALGAVSLFFFSLPEFWLALMLVLVFAYQLELFPIGGMTDPVLHYSMGPLARALDVAHHAFLPVATLTLLMSAVIARFQRAALLDALPSEYVTTARAKGVSESAIVGRHLLRNALLPVISLFGLAFPALLTGAVFVEKVFSWPGMGLVIVNAIATRDYPLLMAGVILGSVLVALGSLVADLLYRLADPRVRGAA